MKSPGGPILLGTAAAALAAGVLILAIASGGEQQGPSTTTQVVRETKVQVVGGGKGGFNAASIYSRAAPGVVTVISVFRDSGGVGDLLGPGSSPQRGLGSGFVLDKRGYIATNAHVVTSGEGSDIKKAKEVYVEFGDRNRVSAEVVGYDANADVGLLKIDPKGLDLVPLPLGNSSRVTVGAPVAAIGSPFGEEQSLSVGVVSATNRTIDSLTSFSIGNAIQTDAAVNHGNSGGPLLDARGRVIGINSQIESSSGGGEGVGFAVPIGAVKRSITQLRAGGHASYAYIGVTAQPLYPQLADRLDLPVRNGALISRVEPGGPADRAGLQAGHDVVHFQAQRIDAGGDVVVQIDGDDIIGENDLSEAISKHRPGDRVSMVVYRDGKRRTVEVEVAARPAKLSLRR